MSNEQEENKAETILYNMMITVHDALSYHGILDSEADYDKGIQLLTERFYLEILDLQPEEQLVLVGWDDTDCLLEHVNDKCSDEQLLDEFEFSLKQVIDRTEPSSISNEDAVAVMQFAAQLKQYAHLKQACPNCD